MRPGVVFDIDDTLYLERDYVASGFRVVAQRVAAPAGPSSQTLFEFLWRGFEEGQRGRAFDELHTAFPTTRAFAIVELIELYRSHTPDIDLSGATRRALQGLRAAGCRVGAISDGPPQSQVAKVAALGLEDFVEPIILTGEWGEVFSKPHPRAYELVERQWRMVGDQLAYVADNPLKDFVTPNRRGWQTVRVRRPGQLHGNVAQPDIEFAATREAEAVSEACDLILSGVA